mmetsp:Transcript_19583/g.68091  ORF Transcript_19583/g.68091 Transcript_19583/m.68091 type:complete len:144 (+) Transcript_19583:2765-3196(+)
MGLFFRQTLRDSTTPNTGSSKLEPSPSSPSCGRTTSVATLRGHSQPLSTRASSPILPCSRRSLLPRLACTVPVLSDQILALHGIGIGIWGWAICLFGPLGSLVLCETLKIFTAIQVRALERKKALRVNANVELTGNQHKQAWK